MTKTLIERWTDKVAEPEDAHNDCWEWTGSKTPAGYGHLGLGTRKQGNVYAHRLSYEFFVGSIPEDCEIDHLCRNRGCVRPDHLEAIPRATHVHRGQGLGFQINAAKTHCEHGHPFNEWNTRYREGKRTCLACERIIHFRAYHRRKGGC